MVQGVHVEFRNVERRCIRFVPQRPRSTPAARSDFWVRTARRGGPFSSYPSFFTCARACAWIGGHVSRLEHDARARVPDRPWRNCASRNFDAFLIVYDTVTLFCTGLVYRRFIKAHKYSSKGLQISSPRFQNDRPLIVESMISLQLRWESASTKRPAAKGSRIPLPAA